MWTARAPIEPRPDGVGGVEARHPAILPRAAGRRSRSSPTRSTSASARSPPEDEIARVRQRYQLDEPFVLYAGNIKPHKNLERLIEAFHMLRREGGFDEVKLLIIGDEISKYATLRRAVHRLPAPQARPLPRVRAGPDAGRALPDWPRCSCSPRSTRGSACRRSRPWRAARRSITSNVSSLPEVVGDAALLIDPYEPGDIADAMRACSSTRRCAPRSSNGASPGPASSPGSGRSRACARSTARSSRGEHQPPRAGRSDAGRLRPP